MNIGIETKEPKTIITFEVDDNELLPIITHIQKRLGINVNRYSKLTPQESVAFILKSEPDMMTEEEMDMPLIDTVRLQGVRIYWGVVYFKRMPAKLTDAAFLHAYFNITTRIKIENIQEVKAVEPFVVFDLVGPRNEVKRWCNNLPKRDWYQVIVAYVTLVEGSESILENDPVKEEWRK
jgi:hypothetical protein